MNADEPEWRSLIHEVRVDVVTGGSTTVRIAHMPSGHTAEASEPEDGRGQVRLREVAQALLVEKLRGTEWLSEETS